MVMKARAKTPNGQDVWLWADSNANWLLTPTNRRTQDSFFAKGTLFAEDLHDQRVTNLDGAQAKAVQMFNHIVEREEDADLHRKRAVADPAKTGSPDAGDGTRPLVHDGCDDGDCPRCEGETLAAQAEEADTPLNLYDQTSGREGSPEGDDDDGYTPDPSEGVA